MTSCSSRSWGTWPPKGWMQEVTCGFSNRFWVKGYLWVYRQRYSQLLIICSQHGLLEGRCVRRTIWFVLSSFILRSFWVILTPNTTATRCRRLLRIRWSKHTSGMRQSLHQIAPRHPTGCPNWTTHRLLRHPLAKGANRWAFEFCCPCLIHPYSFSTCIVLQYLNCALEKNYPFCVQVLAVR